MGRTVLVDNDPFSGLLQPCNVLPTRAFHGEASDRCTYLGLARLARLGTDADKLCLHSYRPALDSSDTLCLHSGSFRVITLSLYYCAILSNGNRLYSVHETCLTRLIVPFKHLTSG